MNVDQAKVPNDTEREERLAQVIEDVLRRRARGEPVTDEAIVASHPDLVPELGETLGALQRVEEAAQQAKSKGHPTENGPQTGVDPPDDPPADLPHGSFPAYVLSGEVHRGGQRVVYRATQKTTGRDVAIKVMHEGPFAGPHGRARFQREVRILGKLQHPNIVTIHDSGVAGGSHYAVMDYIDGLPLDAFTSAKRLTVRQILELFVKVCEAVHAAHLHGIIHRDLKPSNILIDASGEPRILDFGLAKAIEDNVEEETRWRSMTLTGQFVGSLPWASPEQADGSVEKIDVRTDVYSLGVVLFQTLTERFPYPVVGRAREVLTHIVETEPARPGTVRSDIDDEVETMVLKCLAKEPSRRYQSVGDLQRDIRRYLADEPIEAKRESTLYMLRKHVRRYRAALAVIAGVLALIIASSLVAWSLYLRSQRNLWEAHLAHARANRLSGQVGRRFESLDALAKAAVIRPSVELRNEAIAAMALTDVRPLGDWIELPLGSMVCFDDRLARYALWNWSGPLRVVRRVDGIELMNLPEPFPYSSAVVFSPEGKLLARGSPTECEVWDVERRSRLFTIPARVAIHGSVAFDSRGTRLGIGTETGDVLIHDLRSGETRTLRAAHAPVNSLDFHPTENLLATSSHKEDDVFVRDILTGDIRDRLPCHGGAWRVKWSPDGRMLAASGMDASEYSVFVWDLVTSRSVTLRSHTNTGTMLGFLPSSDLLVTSAWDGTTYLWDPRTGERLMSMRGGWLGMAADGPRFTSMRGSHNLAARLMEVIHEQEYRSIVAGTSPEGSRGAGESLAVHPSGRFAVSGCTGGVRLWDLRSGAQAAFLPVGQVQDLCFDPHGDRMIVVLDSKILTWPIREGEDVLTVGPPAELTPAVRGSLWHGTLSTDGSRMVVSIDRRRVLVIDTNTGSVLHNLSGQVNVAFVATSATRKLVAAGAWQGIGLRVWDLRSDPTHRDLPVPAEADVAFSPDGRWLVSSSSDLILWDTQTWEPGARFPQEGFEGVPGPIAFSPDGSLLAAGTGGGRIVLIDMASLHVVAMLTPANQVGMGHLAFTPDGSKLVYPHPNGEILYIWELSLIRKQLGKIGLDWDLPPYLPSKWAGDSTPLRPDIDLGEFSPPARETESTTG